MGLVEHNPYIDHIWGLDENLSELIPLLKTEKFTHIIDLHKNVRSLKIKNKLQVPSYAFNKLNLEKGLLTKLKINRLPNKHLIDRYFEGLSDLSIKNDDEGLDFFLLHSNHKTSYPKLNELPQKFITLVIGTAHETKSPPISLLNKIIEKNDFPIVILGGKAEENKGEKLTLNHPKKKLYNLCGKTSILESAAVIGQSSLVITPDTGLMHIAAALNKKIISVWGNTVPEFGMYPYYGNSVIESKVAQVKGLSCRPCSKIGYKTCPKKHFNCMEQQDVEQISDWIKQLY